MAGLLIDRPTVVIHQCATRPLTGVFLSYRGAV